MGNLLRSRGENWAAEVKLRAAGSSVRVQGGDGITNATLNFGNRTQPQIAPWNWWRNWNSRP